MTKVSTNWKTLTQKKILDNRYAEIWEDEVELPDGQHSTYVVWRKVPFSIIIPIDEGGNIYMVRQYRYTVGSLSLEFPMGASDQDSPEETAKRELEEETGIRAQSFKELVRYWSGVGRTNQEAFVYLAEGLSFGEQHTDEGEVIDVEKYSFEEVKKMIDDKVIKDAQTIVAFHYLETHLQKK